MKGRLLGHGEIPLLKLIKKFQIAIAKAIAIWNFWLINYLSLDNFSFTSATDSLSDSMVSSSLKTSLSK